MANLKFRVFDPNSDSMFATKVGIDKLYLFDFDGDNITEQEGLVIMQFTGLKDKNGEDIYEGDILRFIDAYDCSSESGYDWTDILSVGEIKWLADEARYDITNRKTVEMTDILEAIDEVEVIGNIYESPELLTNN